MSPVRSWVRPPFLKYEIIMAPIDPESLVKLLTDPTENLHIEYKSWLDLSIKDDKECLAQPILALANYGGGYIVVGFSEDKINAKRLTPTTPQSQEIITNFTQDNVNSIVNQYAEPDFHCELSFIKHPQIGIEYPIIKVPAANIPTRCKKTGPKKKITEHDYYTRGPGPVSYKIPSAREWDKLIHRCALAKREEILDQIRTIFDPNSLKTPSAPNFQKKHDKWTAKCLERWDNINSEINIFPNGYWYFSYSIQEQDELASTLDMHDLKSILEEIRGIESFIPPFELTSNIRPGDGIIERLPDPSSNGERRAFWCASTQKSCFTIQGYQEDYLPDYAPGRHLDLSLLIWRFTECLLHATRFAKNIDERSNIYITAHWSGIKNRNLDNRSDGIFNTIISGGTSHIDSKEIKKTMGLRTLSNSLPESVHDFLGDFTSIFGFHILQKSFIDRHLKRMLNKRGSFFEQPFLETT